MKLETMKLTELVSDPNNARKHDDKNLEAIKGSLTQFGQRKPIVIGAGNVVIAGNGTLAAAKSLGWDVIEVVRVPDDWSADQAKAFALADNRTAELATWDEQVLAAQVLELAEAGFEVAEFGFEAIEPEPTEPVEEEPLEFDEDEPIVSKLGDIWQVGPHRIACGDSTDEATLARVTKDLVIDAVITDPPYGIAIVQNNKVGASNLAKAGTYRPVIGDENPDIAAVSFNLIQSIFPKTTQCWWGGNHYTGKALLPDASCWLVWDKETGDNNFADAELAWTNHKGAVRIFKHLWAGMLRASERGAGVRIHPTQKPTVLTKWIIETLKIKTGATILDVFAGSGSTLVGAADADCIGIGIELDPFYVDKIVQRLEAQTGLKAELVS